jgi:hypothetical protein
MLKLKLKEASRVHQRLCTWLNLDLTGIGKWVDREGVRHDVLRDDWVFRSLGFGKVQLADTVSNMRLRQAKTRGNWVGTDPRRAGHGWVLHGGGSDKS